VTEVEVCLSAIIGHENLSVLEGAHRAWVNVNVGIELYGGGLQPSRLKKGSNARGGKSLAD
jgi:hypothetical protein